MNPARVVAVIGPTASGKTGLSVLLAERIGGEVVNADAVQLHRGMNIGAAKATAQERREVPHHMLDVLDVTDEANVAVFQRMARAAIDEISGRGRTPILVGGSSLYVRAVIDPLEFPGTDPVLRAQWQAELDAKGPEALHAELARRDPAAAAAILPSNGRRLVRALEVVDLTGSFTAIMPRCESVYGNLTMIGLEVPREVLDERIARRVEQMWADGFVEEVRGLCELGLEHSATASRALGYQQVLAMLRGDITEDEAKEQTILGTRKFARRQDRMFHKDGRVRWLAYDAEDLVEQALAVVAGP